MSTDLVAEDPTRRAVAFESVILTALGWDPETLDVDHLAAAYAWMSDRWNDEAAAPSPENLDAGAISAVFGLVYAARTFHAAHRLLRAYPPGPGPLVELGAGWAPFALQADLASPRAITLVDRDAARLAHAHRLFEACGRAPPTCVATDLNRYTPLAPADALALPFVLNELPDCDDPQALRDHVDRWTDMLTATGRLYLLEPGTPRAAQRLQRLRDDLPAGLHIHAPCTGAAHCPLLGRPRDWCHFTWRLPEGPFARALADRARRHWHEQHLSFLILGRQPFAPDALRILDVRPHGRPKIVARACGPEGLVTLTALRRHPAHPTLRGLEPGSLVRVAPGVERKGDGLRIVESAEVEMVSEV